MIGTQILQRYVVDYGPWMLSWLIIFNAICSLLRTLDTHTSCSISFFGVLSGKGTLDARQQQQRRKAPSKQRALQRSLTMETTGQTFKARRQSWTKSFGNTNQDLNHESDDQVGWLSHEHGDLAGGSVDLCWIFHISWRIPYSKSKKIETMSE